MVGLGLGVLAGIPGRHLPRSLPDRLISDPWRCPGWSIPSYFVAILLVIVFSAQLKLLPASGMRSTDGDLFDFLSRLVDAAALPVRRRPSARPPGSARASVVETFGADFVELLRAKGLRAFPGAAARDQERRLAGPDHIRPAGRQPARRRGVDRDDFKLAGDGRSVYTAISARDLRVVQGGHPVSSQ